jgi:[ribosomal protein S5]-alanine N-acetyltransferase
MIELGELRLIPLAPQHWLALIDGEPQFAASFGFPAAAGLHDFAVSDDVSAEFLALLQSAPPEPDPWHFGFAIVPQGADLVVGTAAFKGPLDADGTVEIAYGIVPAFRGRGLASETAAALVRFAGRTPGVRRVTAHTLPTNPASQRVLEKCGFRCLGEVIDPSDGLVQRWERSCENPA